MPSKETSSLSSLFSSFTNGSFTYLYDIFSSCFPRTSTSVTAAVNKPQPHANQAKWMADLKDKRISFLSGLFGAFKEEIHTDAQLKPGDNGPCIQAHRVLLATRSEIFKNMLYSDGFKVPPCDTITLPELNSEELESLLEFLYSGSLPLEKLEKHVYQLFIAAEKYEIPYLQEFCQCYMLNSLNASSVLDVLETSEVCSNKGLKEIALNFICRNTEAVVFSDKYEALAAKNPQLCMKITREFFMNARNEKISRVRILGFQKKIGLQEKSCKEFQVKAGEGKMGNCQELEQCKH
ncbi:BTB/POZ domain-containing protein At3g56230-like [Durio zibethinus]|uniref:BTB/POZ domain-containing protein At3g56230-like n=1 Tax=Durio zibethinus TaxID=66656 RepID=A0A6P5Z6B3_DURZI|nr:BTB/POZ domain-containing protein At3g56230-like [Durio zibethinus]